MATKTITWELSQKTEDWLEAEISKGPMVQEAEAELHAAHDALLALIPAERRDLWRAVDAMAVAARGCIIKSAEAGFCVGMGLLQSRE